MKLIARSGLLKNIQRCRQHGISTVALRTLLFIVLLTDPSVYLSTAAPSSSSSRHGGSTHDKSFVQRHLAGVQEAMRWLTEPYTTKSTKSRPPTKVKLANVGFGRTGTTSLEAALKILGLETLQDDLIHQVTNLYKGYYNGELSVTDFVHEMGHQGGFEYIFIYDLRFYEWLATSDDAQDIKVIMTVRDNATVWANSWLAVADFGRAFFQPPFVWLPQVQDMLPTLRATEQVHLNNASPHLYKDIPTMEAAYNHHLEYIQAIMPPERLLVFNVKQGWKPLCDFLDKPVPIDKEFPHVNDRVVMTALVGTLWTIIYTWPLLLLTSLWIIFKICKLTCRQVSLLFQRQGTKEKES